MMCLGAIREIADYEIPEDWQQPFLAFHTLTTTVPEPTYLSELKRDEKLRSRWYDPHRNGIDHTRSALAAAHYHATNLHDLEQTITAIMQRYDLDLPAGATIGYGTTRKLDIEYQGFVLACRRCLDYLARALSCYLRTECDSFRSFPNKGGRDEQMVREALTAARLRHTQPLAFVLNIGKESVRNRIAHYEAVSAGSFNWTREGVMVLGGGEDLDVPAPGEEVRLATAINRRLEAVRACVDDMISTFIAAVTGHDRLIQL